MYYCSKSASQYADTFTCSDDSAYSPNIKLVLKYEHPTNLYCGLGHQHRYTTRQPPDKLDISRPQENGRLFYIANYDNAQVSLVPLPQNGSLFGRQSRKLSPPGRLGKVTCIQNLLTVVPILLNSRYLAGNALFSWECREWSTNSIAQSRFRE